MIFIKYTQDEADAIAEPKFVWNDAGRFIVYTGSDIPVNPTRKVIDSAITVDYVNDLAKVSPDYKTVIVKSATSGGVFNWSESGIVDNGVTFAGMTGVWVRQYDGAVQAKWYTGMGIGSVDYTSQYQLALNTRNLHFTAGTYTISAPLTHVTSDALTVFGTPRNGVVITGDGAGLVTIKASSTFPAGEPLINLDGNGNGSNNNLAPVAQKFSHLSGFSLDGLDGYGKVIHGLRLRAVVSSSFVDIAMRNIGGTGIKFAGTTINETDDADTSYGNNFTRITMDICGEYCISALDNRISNNKFDSCDFRKGRLGGFIGGFAGLTFISCNFSSCGYRYGFAPTGGGIKAVKPATLAETRGLFIIGGEFEANGLYEVEIDFCNGFEIDGLFSSPYQSGDNTQVSLKIGTTQATGGKISGVRLQDYSKPYAYEIIGVQLLNVTDTTVGDISFGHATSHYDVSSGASTVEIAHFKKTKFRVSATSNAIPIASVTGDGTETNTDLFYTWLSPETLEYNVNSGYANGVFTAPNYGLYSFDSSWMVTNLDTSVTSLESDLLVNGLNRYNIDIKPVIAASSLTTDVWKVGGEITVYLNKGDTVVATLKASGSASKTVSVKTDKFGTYFSGRAA